MVTTSSNEIFSLLLVFENEVLKLCLRFVLLTPPATAHPPQLLYLNHPIWSSWGGEKAWFKDLEK